MPDDGLLPEHSNHMRRFLALLTDIDAQFNRVETYYYSLESQREQLYETAVNTVHAYRSTLVNMGELVDDICVRRQRLALENRQDEDPFADITQEARQIIVRRFALKAGMDGNNLPAATVEAWANQFYPRTAEGLQLMSYLYAVPATCKHVVAASDDTITSISLPPFVEEAHLEDLRMMTALHVPDNSLLVRLHLVSPDSLLQLPPLGMLANLRAVSLDWCHNLGIDAALEQLPEQLNELHLTSNQLLRVPPGLRRFQVLEELMLDNNPGLAEVPGWIFGPRLTHLGIRLTAVADLPPCDHRVFVLAFGCLQLEDREFPNMVLDMMDEGHYGPDQ